LWSISLESTGDHLAATPVGFKCVFEFRNCCTVFYGAPLAEGDRTKRNEEKKTRGPCIRGLLRRDLNKWAVLHWIFGLIDVGVRYSTLSNDGGGVPTRAQLQASGVQACMCMIERVRETRMEVVTLGARTNL